MAIYLGNKRVDNGGGGSANIKYDGDGKQFLADDGTYKSIINDTAANSEITSYSAKQTEKRLEDIKNSLSAGQETMVNMWQKTTLSAVANTPISYITDDENSIDKIVVQCYKFIPGEENIVQVLKDFNNGDEANFYHTDNVEFNGVARIKDEYVLGSILNNDGLYESDVISKEDFLILNRIEVDG